MQEITIKNPHYSTETDEFIDATITINGSAEMPYTFREFDPSGLGGIFFERIKAGEFGPVGPYVPPQGE